MTQTKRKAAKAIKQKPMSKAVALDVRVSQLEAVVKSLANQVAAVQDHVVRVDNAAGEYVLKLESAVTALQARRSKK